ncbi:hypothetical protein [Allohahella sp. A8]|uniref:hypothetical protein n=1 Tax=Allohahella sp. A8 TaxID=3141461 RepID=UPI000C0BAAEA|nr:hypothetical protein [Hahellaceae bacterium]|tara:strand:- start:15029 stop:16081 length:1053 start_codon:yes stop_codon:yes gene_type:complete
MEPLKPDFDELDRPGTGRGKATVQRGTGEHHRTDDNAADDSSMRAGRDSYAASGGHGAGYGGRAQPAQAAKGSGSTWLLWLLLLALAAGGGYVLYLQQQIVDNLQDELTTAQTLADESQKLAGELEGQLSQTDATLAQSGNEMARALKKMDAQLRKLEKSTAAETAEAAKKLAALEKSNAVLVQKQLALDAQLGTANKAIEQHTRSLSTLSQLSEDILAEQNALSATTTALETRLGKVDEAVAQMAEQAGAATQERLAAITGKIEQVDKGLSQLQSSVAQQGDQLVEARKLAQSASRAASREVVTPETMKSLQQQVDSIDAARQQLVQRFVAVDRRLNELALQLNLMSSQ